MAWRAQISDRPIQRLDILTGKPSSLAVWTAAHCVTFLDLQTGACVAERALDLPRLSERKSLDWNALLEALPAPNGVFPPVVRTADGAIYSAADGTLRVYRIGLRALVLDRGGVEAPLDLDDDIVLTAVALDRTGDVTAALDTACRLHIWRGQVRVGAVDTGLTLEADSQPQIVVSKQGASIIACAERRVVLFDGAGQRRKSLDLHYRPGMIAGSQDGRLLAITDLESAVIRVYSGIDLQPTHQRFAVDLLADSRRAQLTSVSVAPNAAPGPLAINNKGVVAFALAGIVGVTSIAKMKPLPRPKAFS